MRALRPGDHFSRPAVDIDSPADCRPVPREFSLPIAIRQHDSLRAAGRRRLCRGRSSNRFGEHERVGGPVFALSFHHVSVREKKDGLEPGLCYSWPRAAIAHRQISLVGMAPPMKMSESANPAWETWREARRRNYRRRYFIIVPILRDGKGGSAGCAFFAHLVSRAGQHGR
jgi:hypothetical protein